MGDAENPETAPAAAVAAAEVDFFSEKARPIDPDVAARVLRKIDLFLMPAMMIGMSEAFIAQGCRLTKCDRLWPCILGQSESRCVAHYKPKSCSRSPSGSKY